MKNIWKTVSQASKTLLMFTVLSLLLAGCNMTEEEKKEYTRELNKQINTLSSKSDLSEEIEDYDQSNPLLASYKEEDLQPLISSVGGEKKVLFVKHSSESGYSVALTSSSGDITWHPLGFPDGKLSVKFDESISESRLVRESNYVGVQDYDIPPVRGISEVDYQYTLYINEDDLEGESYEKSCGKNCTKQVDETILP